MLTIRAPQMHTLGQARRRNFALRAAAHLQAHLPECAAMPPAALQSLVDAGIAKAASYSIQSENEVCKFLNLLVLFGPTFDVDLPWAKNTLTAKDGPSLRLNRLYARAIRVADGEELA